MVTISQQQYRYDVTSLECTAIRDNFCTNTMHYKYARYPTYLCIYIYLHIVSDVAATSADLSSA